MKTQNAGQPAVNLHSRLEVTANKSPWFAVNPSGHTQGAPKDGKRIFYQKFALESVENACFGIEFLCYRRKKPHNLPCIHQRAVNQNFS